MGNEQKERVSVIMLMGSADRGLARRLESVTGQMGSDDEILLVARDQEEDGSFNGLVNGVRAAVITGATLPERLNAALRQASGEFIFLADSCDTWHPGKRAACLAALQEGATAVVHDAVVVDGDLNELKGSLLGHRFRPDLFSCLFHNRAVGCCMAFRREILNTALPVLPHGLPDYWFLAAAQRTGLVTFIGRTLIFYCSPRTAAGKHRVFGKPGNGLKFRDFWYVYIVLPGRIRRHRKTV